jgi:hypothetical protein
MAGVAGVFDSGHFFVERFLGLGWLTGACWARFRVPQRLILCSVIYCSGVLILVQSRATAILRYWWRGRSRAFQKRET